MHDSTSTAGPQRPRVRRGLGVLVGVAMLAMPLVMAPGASAQAVNPIGNVPPGVAPTVQQAPAFLVQVVQGIVAMLQKLQLLGDGSTPGSPCPQPSGTDIGASLSCVITALNNALNPPQRAKAGVKRKLAKARAVR